VFKILRNGQCYTPYNKGCNDIAIVSDRIYSLDRRIEFNGLKDVEIIDCSSKIICPGIIDQHVHILGGGGEEGPSSRVPELMLTDITTAGVTTLVGVLGVDDITRNMGGLVAKAQALQTEGIETYVYTGSYSVPTSTLTGKVITDIAFVDKIIGTGEIAISDYRSSHPTTSMLRTLASETVLGGMIGSKAGIMHVHVGDGKKGLSPLLELINESDFPAHMFVPTHLNRNKELFNQAMDFVKQGGQIDLTAGETSERGYSVPDAIKLLIENNIDMNRVTLTSDGNGSMPYGGGDTGVGKVSQLLDDIRSCILQNKLDIELVLKTVTVNAAKVLKLFPRKGVLQEGSDADILVLNKGDLSIDKLFIKGEKFIDNGVPVKRGRFEQ